MAVQLNQAEFQGLVRILQKQPEFADPTSRQQLLTFAFGMSDKANVIMARLNLGGTPMGAAVEVVRFLATFGQVTLGVEALGVFLDQVASNMGYGDDADFIADLIARHNLVNPPALRLPADLPTPDAVAGASSKQVFISYARPQQAIAEQVERYLLAAGYRVFRDTRDIAPGDNWDMTIEQALNASTHMVLLLSAASMPYRKEVHREWFYFDQQQKPILPLYVQDCTLHSRMTAYNYIDARGDLLPDALERLVTRLG